MGLVKFWAYVFAALFAAYLSATLFGDNNPPVLSEFNWGTTAKDEDTSIRPFTINVDDKVLTDLKKRLQLELSPESVRLREPFHGQGFQYGFNTNFVKKVGDYWLNKYDWRAREKKLNKLTHFKTTIQGLEIHYIHAKSNNNKKYNVTMPLLLLHSGVGSFVEYQKLLPLLTDPVDDAINFEVVVPSYPGFGFSQAPNKPGLGDVEAAQLFLRLMQRLGHERFYVRGDDLGSVIATNMAAIYHRSVIAIHLNTCFSTHPRLFLRYIGASLLYPLFYTDEESSRLLPPFKPIKRLFEESGALHMQVTRPDTLATALSNSPIGLAAYILEKFAIWTNSNAIVKEDGGLSEAFSLDELLDNVMLHWATNSIGPAMRFTKEMVADKGYGMYKVPTYVPAACQVSPHKYVTQAETLLVDKYPQLMSYSVLQKPGHFASMQSPQDVAEDLTRFFLNIEQTGLSVSYLRKL